VSEPCLHKNERWLGERGASELTCEGCGEILEDLAAPKSFTGESEAMSDELKFSIAESIANQSALCKANDYPHFAPRDGNCWKCRKNVYEHPSENGGQTLVTGCPWCNWSYCE
jgi:hypothetical protein